MSQLEFDSNKRPDFLDKCHKYGWIISIVGTVIIQLVLYSFYIGQFKQGVESMKTEFGSRMDRLEHQVDALMLKTK